MRFRIRTLLLLSCTALATTLSGCYASIPVDLANARPGARVEVALTARGSEDLARVVGPNVGRVEGDVVHAGRDSVLLALVRTEKRDGIDDLWQRQRIAVAGGVIAQARERRLSRARTWLLAGGAMLGVAALGASFIGSHSAIVGSTGTSHTTN